MTTLTEELHRKALDCLSSLVTERDSGRVSAEAFRVGVETIWNCLGGVLDSKDFDDLIHLANQEVAANREAVVKVLRKGEDRLVLAQSGHTVFVERLQPAKTKSAGTREFLTVVEAKDFLNVTCRRLSECGCLEMGL
jgi:hypothetical protein